MQPDTRTASGNAAPDPHPQTRHWEHAQQYLRQGQVAAAIGKLRALRSIDPDGVRTHLLAVQIDWRQGHLREAADRALVAAERADDDLPVLVDLIRILRQVGETACAHAVFAHGAWQRIRSAGLMYQYALLCQAFGAYKQALAAFDRLAMDAPDNATWDFFRGQQLVVLGRFEEAEAAYKVCLARSPGFGYAAYKLVRLRPHTDGDKWLDVIDAGLQRVQPRTSGRADFEFARYHVLEDLGRDDQAWRALESANAAMYALGLADAVASEAGLRDFCARMSAQSIPVTGKSPAGACPIFIIGMPRSGTTVLERMLANHSQVVAVGELTDFGAQLRRVLGQRDLFGGAAGEGLAALDHFEVGRRYLAQTAWRAAGNAYFIDKQPTNWMMVGLIRAALPQAKIVHLVRDPMDTCFSMWRARFDDAHAWSCRLDLLPGHFTAYRQLMDHWKRLYPDAILDVDYAALVNDPAGTLRDVMAFCGLDWEPGCEDPSRNHGPVSTLSSTQIREPVNTRGMGRWRRYAAQLEPLRQSLSRL